MVLVTDVWPNRLLLHPFVGTGLLGGYTTFSTYIVDIHTCSPPARPAPRWRIWLARCSRR